MDIFFNCYSNICVCKVTIYSSALQSFKVKKDIFLPIAAILKIAHTWDCIKKKQIFLHSVR